MRKWPGVGTPKLEGSDDSANYGRNLKIAS